MSRPNPHDATSAERSDAAAGHGPEPTGRARQILIAMIVFSFVSTTLHYTHNYLYAEDYPPVPLFFPNALVYRVGIVIFWPLLTAAGIWGYFLFRKGHWRDGALATFAYSLLGFTTIFHYTGGVPQIPAFFTFTIFTDFVSGSLLLGFSVWMFLTDRRRQAPEEVASGS